MGVGLGNSMGPAYHKGVPCPEIFSQPEILKTSIQAIFCHVCIRLSHEWFHSLIIGGYAFFLCQLKNYLFNLFILDAFWASSHPIFTESTSFFMLAKWECPTDGAEAVKLHDWSTNATPR